MATTQSSTSAPRDNLDRLLALLDAARLEEEARKRVSLPKAYRALLRAIEAPEPATACSCGAAA